jgi:peptidoglycan/LPS O-acetylase OafA/YrhL
MTKNTEHIAVVESLRGLSAILIILFHFVVKTIDFIQDENVLTFFGFFDLGVPIFFVISGIVIPYSLIKTNYNYSKLSTFLLKRCARIEPPYLITVGIAFAYIYLRQLIPGTTASDYRPGLWDLAMHLGYLVPFIEGARWLSEVFWTLAIEFQYYLLLALCMPLLMYRHFIGRWTFFILFAASSYLPFGDRQILFWSPIFLCGILYALKYLKVISLKEYAITAISCLIFVYLKMGLENFITASFTVFILVAFPHLRTRVGDFYGSISYSLYLLHMLTGGALVNILSHHAHNAWQKFVVVVVGFAFATACGYIFNRLVEKPSMQWSKRIQYKTTK